MYFIQTELYVNHTVRILLNLRPDFTNRYKQQYLLCEVNKSHTLFFKFPHYRQINKT